MNASIIQTRLEKVLGYLERDSGNFFLLSEASDLSLQLGDWPNATELVGKALALQPEDPVTRYRMAVILLHERKPEESLRITQALLDAGQVQSPVRFEHGRGLAMAARFEEAETIFASLLAAAAEFPELPYLYIRTLHHLGKVDEAIAFAQSYVAEHREDGIAQGMLSLLYLDRGDIADAAEMSARVLERIPDNIDALIAAGCTSLAYENQEEAKGRFQKVISLHDKSGRAWAGLGLVNMLNMDLAAARSNFEKVVQFMPTHLGSYSALSWIQILQHDYTAARKTLEKSLNIDRTFSECHGGLAVLAAIEGDWNCAKQMAEIAVRLQPDSFSGRFAQSLIMKHRGQSEQAREMVESMFQGVDVPAGGSLQNALQRFVLRQKK